MVNKPPQTILGWQKLTFTHSTSLDSFPVRVKPQNSTIENVKLMEELLRFTDAQFPDAVNKYLALPQAFQYNQNALKHIQGFPEEAEKRTDVEKDWKSKGLGDCSEAETFRALETLFQKRQSLLLTGLKTNELFKLARESAHCSKKQKQKSNKMFSYPLTNEERMFCEASGIDLLELETQLRSLVAATPHSPNISRDNLVATISSQTERPGFDSLDDEGKGKYVRTMTREVDQMFHKGKEKGKKDLSPDEVVSHLIRPLLNFIEKHSEFDFLLADRSSSTFFQVEVKSFPQGENQDHATLAKNMDKLIKQLAQGNKFFQKVLAPASHFSSSWRKLNIGCFPAIKNRQQLKALGVDDNSLEFILTAEELESGTWIGDLGLPACQAPEEEYKRLLAVCMGSQHVAFNCQVFDFEAEHEETQAKLVGKRHPGEVVGIGGDEGLPQDGATSINFSDLKEKPLGHTWSILFWTQEQLNLLEKLKSGENIVLCGDYGTGKTSLLVFAAMEAAKDPNSKVFFIPVTNMLNSMDTNNYNVLDLAVKMKFEGTNVRVITIGDLGVHRWNHSGGDERHHLIREYTIQ